MPAFALKIETPVAIIGLGVSGEAALQLLEACGISRAKIATYDQHNPLAEYTSPHDLIADFKPKTLIVSPGVPLSQAWIQDFKKSGGTITSELSLATQALTTEKIMAVTGSLGKSTVVSLLGVALRSFSETGFVGGNLGTPLAKYTAEVLLGLRQPADWLVLELSSYQIENCEGFQCDLAAMTYLTANHLERYQSLEDYYQTKWRLTLLNRGALVVNKNGGDLESFATKMKTSSPLIWSSRKNSDLARFHLEQSLLLGLHNQDNLALACRLVLQAGWPDSSVEAMKSFRGLPHRLENLGIKNHIQYVNDSKATTIESVITAVESLRPSVLGQIHLLLGGRDKSLPWGDLKRIENLRPIQFYFFGECRSVAKARSTLSGLEFLSMRLAVVAAQDAAKAGDLILLAPGGTSLDEFKNFEARGNAFRSMISN